jgi:hypothetical protein
MFMDHFELDSNFGVSAKSSAVFPQQGGGGAKDRSFVAPVFSSRRPLTHFTNITYRASRLPFPRRRVNPSKSRGGKVM